MPAPTTDRFTAGTVGALLAALAVAACGSAPALTNQTITVTVDGKNASAGLVPSCHQQDKLWTIEAGNKDSGLTVILTVAGAQTKAESVQIRNLAGFTGQFWADTVGQATATVLKLGFTINGEAQGSYAETPNKSVTAKFDISASC
jgi:hypothetical protein